MLTFGRITLNVAVAEQPFRGLLLIPSRQPDNDDVDLSNAPCFVGPQERSVRKRNLQAVPVEKQRPQLRDLLPDGVSTLVEG